MAEQRMEPRAWNDPLVLAVAGAVVAALANISITFFNAGQDRQTQQTTAEKERDQQQFAADTSFFQTAIEASDDQYELRARIKFLKEAGLIRHKDFVAAADCYIAGESMIPLTGSPKDEILKLQAEYRDTERLRRRLAREAMIDVLNGYGDPVLNLVFVEAIEDSGDGLHYRDTIGMAQVISRLRAPIPVRDRDRAVNHLKSLLIAEKQGRNDRELILNLENAIQRMALTEAPVDQVQPCQSSASHIVEQALK